MRNEEFGGLHSPMQIRVVDTRADKEIVGPGAKPTIGQHVLGYLFFSVAYAPIHALNRNGPQVPEEAELPETVRRAFVERFSTNGVLITDAGDVAPVLLEIELNKFLLDFSSGLGPPKLVTGRRSQRTELCCAAKPLKRREQSTICGVTLLERLRFQTYSMLPSTRSPQRACTRKST